ncbi:hypothetical protein EH240_35540 [Mesorhizobium tamadayense]|uniref:Uncharacterized protein n=1 Tax=Mesorhizobium tamadayense TaxID=425306 RepID=A0A3P3EP85_9HYPH|nr:hypothetical protein [Mesorhizobium tamadayense]RRH88199.1 hypothetical protein EH240_35540 [Mesorhizobium tamadayense]
MPTTLTPDRPHRSVFGTTADTKSGIIGRSRGGYSIAGTKPSVLPLEAITHSNSIRVGTLSHVSKRTTGTGSVVELIDKFKIGGLPQPERKLHADKTKERCIAVVIDFASALDLGDARNGTQSGRQRRRNRQIADDKALVAKPHPDPKFTGCIVVLAKPYGSPSHTAKNETSANIGEVTAIGSSDHLIVGIVGAEDVYGVPEGSGRKDATKNIDVILRRLTGSERIVGGKIDEGRIIIGEGRSD